MSVPFHSEECELAMFDSYMKTYLRNKCRNLDKSNIRHQKHEVVGTETVMFYYNSRPYEDEYPSENLQLGNDTYVCMITNRKLYEAMSLLEEKYREVLILEFWYSWKCKKIAQYMHVTGRTVRNWRNKAFCSIREYFERNP